MQYTYLHIGKKLLHTRMGILVSCDCMGPLCTGAYRLEIISTALLGSGTVHSHKNILSAYW